MIEWINLAALVLSTIGFTYFYIKSVGPAALEEKIGEAAYKKSMHYRLVASVFEGITIVSSVIYVFFPLPIPIPRYFPWEYWISILAAAIILIPSVTLMLVGVKDAGREALEPRKEHTLYSGIYETVRHPQAIGESVVWLGFSLIVNSPFLFLYSFVFIPLFYWFCIAEEKDLILRYGKPYLEYRERVGFLFPKKRK
ncbi:MAG: methyltransferase family protein [Candidatus Thorarchaeota archaeon]|jgi:protein-S-isoprenylcysteine O-methyltransferase Ste14